MRPHASWTRATIVAVIGVITLMVAVTGCSTADTAAPAGPGTVVEPDSSAGAPSGATAPPISAGSQASGSATSESISPTAPADVLVPIAAFPTGFLVTASVMETLAEDCAGVAALHINHPPLAWLSQEITAREPDGHWTRQRAYHYPSVETAEAALDHLAAFPDRCNERSTRTDAPDTLVLAEPLSVQSPPAADRVSGATVLLATTDRSLPIEVRSARVGRWVVEAASSEPFTAEALFRALTARADGDPSDETLAPFGTVPDLPGLASPTFWSIPGNGPQAFRAAATDPLNAGPEVRAWVDGASDARLDRLAAAACASVHTLNGSPDDLDQTILSVLDQTERAALSAEAAGRLFGLGIAVYCPALYPRVTTNT
jgi:hypothetical protein